MQVLEQPNWPDSLPFRDEDFQRYDPSSDKLFYDQPRFVTHIDDSAIAALTKCVLLPCCTSCFREKAVVTLTPAAAIGRQLSPTEKMSLVKSSKGSTGIEDL